ncbi:MAG: M48 family metallopeptidase [Planctomycetota bacterium]
MSEDLLVAGAKRRQFSYRNVDFPFHLVREERKTLAATVLPSQTVVVKAPVEATGDRIQEFLRRKSGWVLKQRRYFSQFRPQREKRYVSGESFRYRGRQYKLVVRKASERERVSLQHGILTVYSAAPREQGRTKDLLDAWYKKRAHLVFANRLDACFMAIPHQRKPSLVVKKMTRRWGSYSSKTHRIVLNENLIQAATRHIDYVIHHEICHIQHPLHNANFYKELESHSPQWKSLKQELEMLLLS